MKKKDIQFPLVKHNVRCTVCGVKMPDMPVKDVKAMTLCKNVACHVAAAEIIKQPPSEAQGGS